MHYEGEETEQIEEDIKELHNVWEIVSDETVNGPNAHMHFPPALALAALRISQVVNDTSMPSYLGETFEISHGQLANLGSIMFVMGQKSEQLGIFWQNMTPCNCLDLSDETIKNFINGTT